VLRRSVALDMICSPLFVVTLLIKSHKMHI
jgi:hypothetical protein